MATQASLTIRTLFAPFDDTTQAFLDFVGRARKSLEINIYGFHLPQLTALLLAKQQQGVKISIILDHTQAEGRAEAGEVQKLLDAKVPLLIGTSPVHHQILHAKFCVVDGMAVQHGSWNYSLSASQQSNDMHFVEDVDYAQSYQGHHNAIRSFILLHEMTLQPQNEVEATPSLVLVAAADAAVVDARDEQIEQQAGMEQSAEKAA